METINTENKKTTTVKWFLRPVGILMAILFAGPLAIPLVWISPSFKKIHKIAITVLLIVLTVWFFKVFVDLYDALLEQNEQLRGLLNY